MTSPIQLGDGLTLTTAVVGPLRNNAYLLDDGRGRSLLIDAAEEPDRLDELIGARELGDVVTTHRHHDHVGALAHVTRTTGATAWAGRPDVTAIQELTGVASSPLWTGDELEFGDHRVEVIGLVGHTPGSIALVLRPSSGPVQLFTGDSLFPGGVGKTPTPADFTSLLGDVETELFDRFDDDTVVRPGHGDPTTLGTERPHLAEWRARGW